MNLSSHNKKVERISDDVKRFYDLGKKFRIYHGSTNSTRRQDFKKDEIIDVSELNNILEINTDKEYVIVEPNVPMDHLAKTTLKHGYIPPVIMEFPGITVGGGIQGGAGESSSFKWGLFHNIAEELEIILGNGEVIICSPSKNTDLFYGTSASYGSLGIITKAKIRLIKAKPFIKVTYQKVESFKEMIEQTKNLSNPNNEYVDGIMFSKKCGVAINGVFSDKQELPISKFSGSLDNWFYLHAEKIANKYNNYEELVPIFDYLFRYDRGGFWVGRYPYNKVKIPFNKFTRMIFNPILHTRTLYRVLHAINISQRFFIQDFALPLETSEEFLNYTDDKTQIYPIWICPLKPTQEEKLSAAYIKTKLVIDIGVWGKLQVDYDSFVRLNLDFEKKLTELGGRKWLYAHSYFTENDFWNIYDKKWYDSLRKKYHAEVNLPTIYEKTKVKEKYDFSIINGLWEVIKSPKKLPVKN